MSKTLRQFCFSFALLLSVVLMFAYVLPNTYNVAFAEEELSSQANTTEGGYFYNQLSAQAKKFYEAIDAMNTQGLLKTGNAEYDLLEAGTVTQAQLSSYSQNAQLLMDFGAGRDAYTLDHPEVFYIDFSYLSISVGQKNGAYVATLGTGRSDTYYIENGFTSESEVNAAISEFEAKVHEIVETANNAGSTVEDKIKSVNTQLVESIEYSFCSTADATGTTYLDGAAHIRTAYGALVNNKCVCEGYSRAFKVIMDELGIPCVLVNGYALEVNGAYQPHMWNYVQIQELWYAVDVTWNDSTNSEGENVNTTAYLLKGNSAIKDDHFADGVISQSNFEFKFPALNPYDFGKTVDANGLTIKSEYDGNLWNFEVSYEGKNATQLAEEEGLYMSYRNFYETGNDGEMVWGNWMYLGYMAGTNEDGFSRTQINTYVYSIQFALITRAPDSAPFEGSTLYIYNSDTLLASEIKNASETFVNDKFGSYHSHPYIKLMTPVNTAPISVTRDYDVTITYTEKLKKVDEDKPVEVKFTTQASDTQNYAEVTNVVWDASEPDKIRFKFSPSRMYQHRSESYSFYVVNLVGVDSELSPMVATYISEQANVICNKVYGDGRLYMSVFGQPSLIATEDLSLTGFKIGEDYVAENQRSQLVLVATKPTASQSDAMLDSAASEAGVEKSQVLASETFELELNICGNITQIPNGSYMQLAFGFPAGYGPEDAGVTFKVYHFKRVNGKIDYSQTEELDCVITEYGLVVTVTDFSPFAVVALSKDDVNTTTKNIFASTVGNGGSLQTAGIAKVSKNGSVTYNFLADTGYQVDRVLLNGQAVQISNNTLTLNYDDLAEDNTLEVSFVASRVLANELANAVTYVYPTTQVVDPMGNISVEIEAETLQVAKGGEITLKANVKKEGALVEGEYTFVWYKDGVKIAESDEMLLNISNISEEDFGSYTVTVTNLYGSRTKTTSSAAVELSEKTGMGTLIYWIIAVVAAIVVCLLLIIPFKLRKKKN